MDRPLSANIFPACDYPQNILVTQPAIDSVRVQWTGSAWIFKVAWKRQDTEIWNTETMPGVQTFGGSGINTDDTGGGLGIGGTGTTQADFTLAGLPAGDYDLRMINICQDLSTYIEKQSFTVSIPASVIPNLRFAPDPGSDNQINLLWDSPGADSGQAIIVSWCQINTFGQKLNCENAQLGVADRSYTILYPEPGRYMIWVSQPQNQWQESSSNVLYVTICDPENACGASALAAATGGGQGSGSFIVGEQPQGAVNGLNTTFFTVYGIKLNSEQVMINGLTQTRGTNYSIDSGNRIVFTSAPAPNLVVSINYISL